jgi:hypothetical protein
LIECHFGTVLEIQGRRFHPTIFVEKKHVPAGVVFGGEMTSVRCEVVRLNRAVFEINSASKALNICDEPVMPSIVGFDASKHGGNISSGRRQEYDAIAR